MDGLPAPRMPSVSQSKSSHLNFFRTPVWKSMKRYSTGTEFADCTKATNIRSPDAQRPVRARQLNDSSELKETPMKFRPLHDRVVIERIDAEAKTAGGIIIPDTAKEKPQQARSSPLDPAAATRAASSSPST
jgi:hypothetical protein